MCSPLQEARKVQTKSNQFGRTTNRRNSRTETLFLTSFSGRRRGHPSFLFLSVHFAFLVFFRFLCYHWIWDDNRYLRFFYNRNFCLDRSLNRLLIDKLRRNGQVVGVDVTEKRKSWCKTKRGSGWSLRAMRTESMAAIGALPFSLTSSIFALPYKE